MTANLLQAGFMVQTTPYYITTGALETIRQGRGELSFVVGQLADEPELLSVELLRRVKLEGWQGGKSALYELIQSIRAKTFTTDDALRGSSRGVQPARLR
jgi:hypothetical protein